MAGGFVQALNAAGFDAVFKREIPDLAVEFDDVEILKWARAHRRILWGFDKHRNGSATGQRMNDEISRHKGRLIQMSGGPEQSIPRAIGRLLVHQEHWEPFFADNHGKVRIMGGGATQIRMETPGELPRLVAVGVRQGAAYLEQRERWHLRGRLR